MRFSIVTLIVSAIVSGGCVSLKQPGMDIDYYTLEYDKSLPVTNAGLDPVQAVIKVERLNIAPAYNTNRIIYRDQSFKRASYFYHKWKANPADMITHLLTRDTRRSGLFKAVVIPGSKTPHTHIVEGSVDELLEWDSKDKWEAVLSVNVTLLDAEESNISKKVIFQQRFSARKKCEEKHPKALVQAMSEAMAEVSENICMAVYNALSEK